MQAIHSMISRVCTWMMRPARLRRFILALVVLVGVYAAGIGPAWRLHATGHLSQTLFLGVYGPTIDLLERAPTPIHHSFDSYMRFWFDYGGRLP